MRGKQAYLDTHCVVLVAPLFMIRIEVVSPELLAEYRASGHPGSAFVTACSPFSRSFDDAENRARQSELLAALNRRGLHCLAGHGLHPSNDWPAEPNYPVLGPDAIPQLILLR